VSTNSSRHTDALKFTSIYLSEPASTKHKSSVKIKSSNGGFKDLYHRIQCRRHVKEPSSPFPSKDLHSPSLPPKRPKNSKSEWMPYLSLIPSSTSITPTEFSTLSFPSILPSLISDFIFHLTGYPTPSQMLSPPAYLL
jgi:hypothetical protein